MQDSANPQTFSIEIEEQSAAVLVLTNLLPLFAFTREGYVPM